MVRLAPNMRLKLLSSRVVIKKTIAERIRSKDEREDLLRYALGNHADTVASATPLCDQGRFEPVSPSSVTESALVSVGPSSSAADAPPGRRTRRRPQGAKGNDGGPGAQPEELCSARALVVAIKKLEQAGKRFEPDVSIALAVH
eukprot:4393934-Alexandrium_andersonii.AAC.1